MGRATKEELESAEARREEDRVVRLDPPGPPPAPPSRPRSIREAAREWLTDIAKRH